MHGRKLREESLIALGIRDNDMMKKHNEVLSEGFVDVDLSGDKRPGGIRGIKKFKERGEDLDEGGQEGVLGNGIVAEKEVRVTG